MVKSCQATLKLKYALPMFTHQLNLSGTVVLKPPGEADAHGKLDSRRSTFWPVRICLLEYLQRIEE